MLDKARYYFEKILAYSNIVGLYSAQLGLNGEHFGNFPQCIHTFGVDQCCLQLRPKPQ